VFVNYIINKERMRDVIWQEQGLVNDIWFIQLFNIVVGPFLNLVRFEWIIKLIKRKTILAQGKNCKLNQHEANLVFEGDTFDVSERFSLYIRTLLVSLFFMPILPISTLLGLIAVLVCYWTDKFLLYSRQQVPAATGADLAFSMYHFFDFILLIYGVRPSITSGLVLLV
jgi:hypothetical protein